MINKPSTNLCIVTDCTEFLPLDSAKDSLPHVGFCGYSWTWSLWYQTDCFEHRCWHYFTATWAFARQPMAWEQVAVKWGLPATVRWHCGGNPPQHFSLDKLLRDHQPGEKPAALFLFSIGNADHARSSAASSKSRLETKCQQVPIATSAAVWWTDSFFCFGIQWLKRILNWWFVRSILDSGGTVGHWTGAFVHWDHVKQRLCCR